MQLRMLLLAAVGAVVMFCGLSTETADARLFGRRTRTTSANNNCPGGVCRQPGTGGGGLTINGKGGFEGQLPDSYYARYTGGTPTVRTVPTTVAAAPRIATVPAVAVPTTTVQQSIAVAAVPTLAAIPAPVATASVASSGDYEQARKLLETRRTQVEQAEAALAVVSQREQGKLIVQAAEMQADISLREVRHAQLVAKESKAIDAMKAEHLALEARAKD